MKFKRLPPNELQKLEKDFIDFLVSNGITAEDWVKLKNKSLEKANDLIDLFSDIVYQRAMEKVEYLEYRGTHEMKIFHCGSDTIKMIGIEVERGQKLDLKTGDGLRRLGEVISTDAGRISIFSASKAYKPNREQEIFRMMNAGAVQTDSQWFRLLNELYKKNKETEFKDV